MVTIESGNIDALVARYLLPSAPDGLVGEVRSYLEDSDFDEMPALPARPERSGNGHASGPLPEFSPWQLLHVTRSAPPCVVEVAYRFWRQSHARPDAEPPAPRPPADDRAPAAAEPCLDADDRMSALGSRGSGAPVVERSCPDSADVFLESISGDRRFGIGNEPLRIGVEPGCHVRVPDGGTNVDARIWPHGDRYLLHVADGGVLVNGASASWAVLDDGDILKIGNATFRFHRKDM